MVNCQVSVVDDGITKDIFNVLKHTCLIMFSVDSLIQPTGLNEVFWMFYNILVPHCFNSVKDRLADNDGTLQCKLTF